jgi:hypothetical protein
VPYAWVAVLKLYFKKIDFLQKKISFGGGKFLVKDFAILLPNEGDTFCPKFCP